MGLDSSNDSGARTGRPRPMNWLAQKAANVGADRIRDTSPAEATPVANTIRACGLNPIDALRTTRRNGAYSIA
jgi:hypothetical protein